MPDVGHIRHIAKFTIYYSFSQAWSIAPEYNKLTWLEPAIQTIIRMASGRHVATSSLS